MLEVVSSNKTCGKLISKMKSCWVDEQVKDKEEEGELAAGEDQIWPLGMASTDPMIERTVFLLRVMNVCHQPFLIVVRPIIILPLLTNSLQLG